MPSSAFIPTSTKRLRHKFIVPAVELLTHNLFRFLLVFTLNTDLLLVGLKPGSAEHFKNVPLKQNTIMVTEVIQQESSTTTTEVSLEIVTVSESNEMFRRPKEMEPAALQELADSIQQFGVIQPITLRPHPTLAGQFILIAGERRFRASKLAGKSSIPAYVRDVGEDAALLMQITENIQREDVHPLLEAKAYRVILEKDTTLSTAELSRRCGKSETYVLQRLKLNDLIRQAKRDFFHDLLSLGHAIILARLTSEDQKQVVEQMGARRNGYGTVAELSDYVEHHIMHSLSSAAFDKNDAELFKKAGSCMTCPKRSGASPLLFSDIKQKDKCFDRGCFFTKCERHLLNKTNEVIETQPDVVFLVDWQKPDEKIVQILTENKITPLREYDDFYRGEANGKKVSGLWISGTATGKVDTVYLKKEIKDLLDQTPEMKIEKIQGRMIRSKELDQDKVYKKILESLASHSTQKRSSDRKLLPEEEVLLWYIVLDKASYRIKDDLMRSLGVQRENHQKLYLALRNIKPADRAYLLRRVMLDQYGGNFPRSTYGIIIRNIAAAYGDIDIASFEKRAD